VLDDPPHCFRYPVETFQPRQKHTPGVLALYYESSYSLTEYAFGGAGGIETPSRPTIYNASTNSLQTIQYKSTNQGRIYKHNNRGRFDGVYSFFFHGPAHFKGSGSKMMFGFNLLRELFSSSLLGFFHSDSFFLLAKILSHPSLYASVGVLLINFCPVTSL
jgi:hypothetical protein